ncbi:MAG: hypothetical protein HQL24_08075 [Candidatus Omnitrophica bacterium]|nr:hypothetical protein [Candidatus Omnitrophota bacterium]
MKILHIGDISFSGYCLCQALQKLGVQTTLLSKRKFKSSEASRQDWVLSTEKRIDEFRLCNIDLEQFDIIHVNYLVNLGSLGLTFKKTKRPIILHAHGGDVRPRNILEKMVLQRVLSLSNLLLFSTPDLDKEIVGIQKEKIYLPNPVEIPPLVKKPTTYEKRILIFTTLYKVKQIEKLFPLIQNLDFQFDLIEYGLDIDYYKRLLPANVRLIAPFKKDRVNEEISKYKLILGGSQDGTIRICELEAMVLGIPTLFPFEYDHFYPEKLPQPEMSTQSILKHFGDYDLGEKQRRWVEKYHESENVAKKLLDIYSKVLLKNP